MLIVAHFSPLKQKEHRIYLAIKYAFSCTSLMQAAVHVTFTTCSVAAVVLVFEGKRHPEFTF